MGDDVGDVERGQPLRRADCATARSSSPSYYRKLRQECPECTILAAELLDMPNMLTWVKRFRRYAKVEPQYWGLHNYVEANRFQTTSLKKLLRRVKGQVWLTEVGGIVKRRTNEALHGQAHPRVAVARARVTRFLFDEVVPLSRRITRVYLYHWNASSTQRHLGLGAHRPDAAAGAPRSAVLRRRAARPAGAALRAGEDRGHLRHAPAARAAGAAGRAAWPSCAPPT